MEISATISYLPVRDSLARAGASVDNSGGGQSRREIPRNIQNTVTNKVAEGVASNVTTLDTAASANVAARSAQVTSQPVQEPAPNAGLRFEYENKTQVMKVNDNKGILIYQVPSKGQLELIEAQDSNELSRLAQTA